MKMKRFQLTMHDFLKTSHKDPSSENDIAFIDKQNSSKFTSFYLGVIALVAIAVFILLYRFARKGKH